MARERSFWGWGYADRFPDDEARAAAAGHAMAVLGFAGLAPQPAPRFEELKLPAPRVAIPDEVQAFATQDARERALHTYGRSYRDLIRGFRGDFQAAPDLVIFPRSEADVAEALLACERERIAAVPYGGGTSVVSGIEAAPAKDQRGVATIDLRALDRVLELDETSRAARVQAGATGPALEARLAERGYSLRHYPQSFEFSTLGGWIATRAGGHYATLYTHIDELVESVRMVTPRGEFQTRRLPASGAGPQPERLVCGSEGILGVITEAWMRIQKRPRYRHSASVLFDDFLSAARAARAIAQAGLYPSNCRLLDAREAMLNGVPADGKNVLLLGFESADSPRGPWMDRALQLAAGHGGACPAGPKSRDEGERGADKAAEGWRQAFIDAPYLQSVLVSVGAIADTFETACTWDRFEQLHAEVTRAVTAALKEQCGAGSLTCRFTHVYPDGPAPYFTFVAPARRGVEVEQWMAIRRAASEALLACGATITHHHAVGRLHRPWYDRERPELFAAALRAAKRELDPAGILNPGVLID
jgi:alkyldihydroxyacetonephosphate synthase